jgi:hypothetical protein
MTGSSGLEMGTALERRIQNRRIGSDRRKVNSDPVASEKPVSERRKVERRKLIDPTTCERDYSLDEVEFMRAMDEYKRKNGRMFPTWSEVLEVVRSLGYAKGAVQEIPLSTAGSDSTLSSV